jgi:hypothetical protein
MLALQAAKVLHACYIQHASVLLQISMLVSSKASVLDTSCHITSRFEFLTKVTRRQVSSARLCIVEYSCWRTYVPCAGSIQLHNERPVGLPPAWSTQAMTSTK